jgi:hypothetical protein
VDFLGGGGGVFWVLLAGAALPTVGGGLLEGWEMGVRTENREIMEGRTIDLPRSQAPKSRGRRCSEAGG